MRIAFFSPLPPTRSGIADYSRELLDRLALYATVDAFTEIPADFDPARYDLAVYQLGNNPHHAFVYEMAMKHPGVAVMHEANLHHLVADMTIRRGDWDAYLAAIEHDHGPEALAYARRYVRTVERGPDYELPLIRTILERSRAAIVHSAAVESELRAHGFSGPIGKIPHGAWSANESTSTGPTGRMDYRSRLGLEDSATPLVGIFGFLKPYKRIAESLRAFRRLVRLQPSARMILVGETHPELPLADMIRSLGLDANVRHMGFVEESDFNGYISACDIILNLRFPTVGESSGTLLRALGIGRAVLVSDVGSFREFPDEICLKVPVDASEEDCIFEYLNLLVSRPHLARALGDRAKAWTERECTWDLVAQRYAAFLQAVIEDRALAPEIAASEHEQASPNGASSTALSAAASSTGSTADSIVASSGTSVHADSTDQENPPRDPDLNDIGAYILSWAPDEGSCDYIQSHLTRLDRTLAITPRGGPEDRILEMGAYLQITPALHTRLGYGEVRGCFYGRAGGVDHRTVTSRTGETFSCAIDLFDAEHDPFPYPDSHFSTVLCCELLEHLTADPMFLMSEINRILKPGGHLVLTTPNIASARAISAILYGFHPMLFPAYIRPRGEGPVDARHNREYAAREIGDLLDISGFETVLLETGPFRQEPKPEFGWVEHMLDRYMLSKEHRGDGIYAVGRKIVPVKDRYPAWLYS